MQRHASILALLIVPAVTVLPSGCTVVKPVTCAVVHPINEFGRALKARDQKDEEEAYNDLPLIPLLVVAPILIPINYVAHTVRGAVGGLASGFVSDLNIITGNATERTTMGSMTEPVKTNAPKPR